MEKARLKGRAFLFFYPNSRIANYAASFGQGKQDLFLPQNQQFAQKPPALTS
jgi:hypothetical protein